MSKSIGERRCPLGNRMGSIGDPMGLVRTSNGNPQETEWDMRHAFLRLPPGCHHRDSGNRNVKAQKTHRNTHNQYAMHTTRANHKEHDVQREAYGHPLGTMSKSIAKRRCHLGNQMGSIGGSNGASKDIKRESPGNRMGYEACIFENATGMPPSRLWQSQC